MNHFSYVRPWASSSSSSSSTPHNHAPSHYLSSPDSEYSGPTSPTTLPHWHTPFTGTPLSSRSRVTRTPALQLQWRLPASYPAAPIQDIRCHTRQYRRPHHQPTPLPRPPLQRHSSFPLPLPSARVLRPAPLHGPLSRRQRLLVRPRPLAADRRSRNIRVGSPGAAQPG